MPEESKESKAKKLAAARKKLKEYQQRGTASTTTASCPNTESTSNSGHVSSNISERSESELHLNGSSLDINQTVCSTPGEEQEDQVRSTPSQLEIASYFTDSVANQQSDGLGNFKNSMFANSDDVIGEPTQSINAIQVLITEKAQLTAELNKFRTTCREKDLELEELRVQHANVSRRVDDLQQHLKDQQKQADQQRTHNAELQHKLAQARSQNEDQSSHLLELQQQMQLREERFKLLDHDFKEKCNELELAQLRIRQLSDENNITKDNRVETLTQTQFMYEQQIRDLQVMVQQLTQDREQANNQFQTYVQQLNTQVNQLNERNAELLDESAKLQERDKQMVDHVQQLEKEIQKNITRQAEIKEEKQKDSSSNATTITNQQIQELQDRLQEFETERYEFQLKIKSQEDRLHTMQNEVYQKQQEIIELREHLENVTSEQPDKTKLLAAMESDKVAASRALSQNVELKKQLDELEMRFVQLTNDKADLMNRLDAELYANREMHSNYGSMEERLRTLDERFKFKDEEMIRLSHENEELKKENINFQRKLNGEDNESPIDHDHDHGGDHHEHDHHEHDHHKHDHHEHDHQEHDHHAHDHHSHDHSHNHEHTESQHNCRDEHDSHNHDAHAHGHNHGHHHDHEHHDESQCHKEENGEGDIEKCQEATELIGSTKIGKLQTTNKTHSHPPSTTTPHIATEEAVEKLQQRFTNLMSQVADLTEEKQRLEHLVMQLQSETETIGEYIALYQTQRRILKQREYEKAAQTALLQEEREQMRDRLTMLNNLVNSLGMEIPITQQQYQLQQQLNEALSQSVTESTEGAAAAATTNGIDLNSPLDTLHSPPIPNESNTAGSDDGRKLSAFTTSPQNIKDLSSLESQQILHKIQDIITEIKENTKELPMVQHSVDHLNCCSGKFEVV